MITDPTPTPEETIAKKAEPQADDFDLPAERQDGTNCTDDICTVCQ
ncbi:MAG: hypothetical protein WAL87_00395 [Chthoniobacterales bacterium]